MSDCLKRTMLVVSCLFAGMLGGEILIGRASPLEITPQTMHESVSEITAVPQSVTTSPVR